MKTNFQDALLILGNLGYNRLVLICLLPFCYHNNQLQGKK
jgi:hypothetical protein